MPFVEGSDIDIMLFQGGVKRNGWQGSSIGNALGNCATQGLQNHSINSLKAMLKTMHFTTFGISSIGPDGSRLYSKEGIKSAGGIAKMPKDKVLQTKI